MHEIMQHLSLLRCLLRLAFNMCIWLWVRALGCRCLEKFHHASGLATSNCYKSIMHLRKCSLKPLGHKLSCQSVGAEVAVRVDYCWALPMSAPCSRFEQTMLRKGLPFHFVDRQTMLFKYGPKLSFHFKLSNRCDFFPR